MKMKILALLKKLKKEIGLFWAIYSNASNDWRVQGESCNISDLYVGLVAFLIFTSFFAGLVLWKPAIFFIGFFVSIFISISLQEFHACLNVYFWYGEDENLS